MAGGEKPPVSRCDSALLVYIRIFVESAEELKKYAIPRGKAKRDRFTKRFSVAFGRNRWYLFLSAKVPEYQSARVPGGITVRRASVIFR